MLKSGFFAWTQEAIAAEIPPAAAAVLVVVVASLFTARTISEHRAESDRAAACRLANVVGAGDLEG